MTIGYLKLGNYLQLSPKGLGIRRGGYRLITSVNGLKSRRKVKVSRTCNLKPEETFENKYNEEAASQFFDTFNKPLLERIQHVKSELALNLDKKRARAKDDTIPVYFKEIDDTLFVSNTYFNKLLSGDQLTKFGDRWVCTD